MSSGGSGLAAQLAALYARVPLGTRLGLEPMRAACAAAAHPERSFEAVHVAGTNGKGSTCAMVEATARASGRRTGLYTSPHLCRFAERIRIDGAPIADEPLARALEEALAIGSDLSFFEAATLAAFLAFRAARLDLAIVEVGIGGRLDATNVIPPPRCAAVVSIGLDHQEMLGDTLAAIAREKAAIAKPGVPIVLGPMPHEARIAAEELARRAGARVVTARALPHGVHAALAGAHQARNAAVAWTIAEELELPQQAIAVGVATAQWPARLERVTVAAEAALAGPWILDGAHNPDGVRALVDHLAADPPGAIVFGALADKSWRAMLEIVREVDAPRFYAPPGGRTPAEPGALAAAAPGVPCGSLDEALAAARRAAGPSPVVVCGSLYLVGQARARLLSLPTDPIVAL